MQRLCCKLHAKQTLQQKKYQIERSYGSFRHDLSVPTDVDPAKGAKYPLFILLFWFFIGRSNKKDKVFRISLPNNIDGRLAAFQF